MRKFIISKILTRDLDYDSLREFFIMRFIRYSKNYFHTLICIVWDSWLHLYISSMSRFIFYTWYFNYDISIMKFNYVEARDNIVCKHLRLMLLYESIMRKLNWLIEAWRILSEYSRNLYVKPQRFVSFYWGEFSDDFYVFDLTTIRFPPPQCVFPVISIETKIYWICFFYLNIWHAWCLM